MFIGAKIKYQKVNFLNKTKIFSIIILVNKLYFILKINFKKCYLVYLCTAT